ncbi:hypothetical protein ACFZ8E_23530 [Methylobacterium sp. HMF5984]|uniref:hypothetical protein n=1 Tax=Methylobacterium sp. HMF5984 TaxID=3367370 RepID=UPI003854D36C
MATISDLTRAGVLHPVGGSKGTKKGKTRRFYATDAALDWIVGVSRNSPSSPEGYDETPKLQLYNLLKAYTSGDPLVFDQEFHPMRPGDKKIWELKTIEMRIFGFFSDVDEFVAVVIDYKWRIKLYSLSEGYKNEVETFRYHLGVPYVKENGVHYVLS